MEYQYTVTAVDDQGRESDISDSAIVISMPDKKCLRRPGGLF
jgi:hypothetical protein